MFLICCLIHWVCFWHAALGMLPIKSNAATYAERTIRKKSCLNNLLHNSWKHFQIHSEILFSVWSSSPAIFPTVKISKILLSPSFSSSLAFRKFHFPPDFVEFKNPSPPSQTGGSCYDFADQNLLESGDLMGLKF